MALADLNAVFRRVLSEHAKEKVERVILIIAILSYVVHLSIIGLADLGLIAVSQNFLRNPIAAIYTPFSFILLYEVYLLIYFLPKSITFYIAKQYEIITLIVIRRIFKDIAYIELNADWFKDGADLQFTFDTVTSLILFLVILFFYKNIGKRQFVQVDQSPTIDDKVYQFVRLKQVLAVILIPVLFSLAIYAFTAWGLEFTSDYQLGIIEFKDINSIFYDDFFTILIIVDVLLLLMSLFHSQDFHKIMRNSGFVISTILLKISLSSFGLVSNFLIVGAVVFGLLVLIIHNQYEKEGTET